MTDALQILLAAVISSLTIVLLLIGIQFFFILKEMRQSIIKMNEIIEDTHTVTKTVAHTVEEAHGFISGVKKGAGLVGALRAFSKKINEEEN